MDTKEKKSTSPGSIIVTGVFLLILFGLTLGSLILPDKKKSDMENRVLAEAPKFNTDKLLDGSFGDDLEKYASDQLMFRDQFVMAKNEALRMTGRTRVGEVYFAEDSYIQEFVLRDTYKKNISYIEAWCAENGLGKERTFVCAAPNASELYDKNLPAYNLCQSEQPALDLGAEIIEADNAATFVSPLKNLKKHKKEQIYFDTDHHWTMLGAYYGYEELCKSMGLTPVDRSELKEVKAKEEFYGSLYSQAPLLFTNTDEVIYYDYKDLKYKVCQVNFKTGDKMTEADSFIVEEKLSEKDKYAALFGGNFGDVRIYNETPSKEAKGKKLLIFKDSYANSIIPYLISNYEEIEMIDLRYFDFFQNDITTYGKDGDFDQVLFMYNVSFLNSDPNFEWLLK